MKKGAFTIILRLNKQAPPVPSSGSSITTPNAIMDGLLVSDAYPTGIGEKRTFTDVRAIPSNSKYKTKDR